MTQHNHTTYHPNCFRCDLGREEAFTVVERPYYEVTIRLPLDLYDEDWFDCVAAAAGDKAAVSGSIVPELPP